MDYLKKLRSQTIARLLLPILLCAFIGVIGLSASNVFTTAPEPQYLYDVPRDELEGAYVTVNVDYIYGCYAYTETYENDKPTGKITEREYLIDANVDDYICLIVSGDLMDKAEKLLEQSDAYYYGEIEAEEITASFVVTGRVKTLPSDSLDLLHDAVGYSQLSAAEQDIYLPLYLSPEDYNTEIVPLLFGIGFMATAIILLVLALTGHYQKQLKEKLLQLYGGNTQHTNDLMNYMLNSVPQTAGVSVGSGYVLARIGSGHELYDSNDLVWAYKQVTRQKMYGIIPMGKTYALMLMLNNGKSKTLPMKEKQVNELLQAIGQQCPTCVIGYSDQLASMYRSNRSAMAQVAAAQRSNVQQ